MKKLVFVCLIFSIFLSSCGKKPTAEGFFEGFRTACELPAGVTYRKSEKASEADTLSKEMFDALYATAPDTDYYEECTEAVVWLGSSIEQVCEAAVFVCPDRESAEEIAFMCRARVALLLSLSEQTDVVYARDARVRIYGTTVFMCALPNNEKAEKLARKYFT